MELLSRKRWRLVSGQMVSCCVCQNSWDSLGRTITKFIWLLDWLDPSSPSTKEFHDSTIEAFSYIVWITGSRYVTPFLITVIKRFIIVYQTSGKIDHLILSQKHSLYRDYWKLLRCSMHNRTQVVKFAARTVTFIAASVFFLAVCVIAASVTRCWNKKEV